MTAQGDALEPANANELGQVRYRRTVMISTDAVAQSARLEYWAEMILKTCGAEFERPPEGCGFYGSVDVEDRGSIRVGRVQAAAQSVLRTPGKVAKSNNEQFFLTLQLRGRACFRQAGRGGALEPGEFALFDATRPYHMLFPDAFSQLVLTLPSDTVVSRLPDAHRLTACTVATRVGTGRVASMFIRQLVLQIGSVDAESLPRLQASLLDLVTTALAEQRNADTSRSASKNVLIQRVLRFIEDHLGNPDLTCRAIAARHRISERYLRYLFGELAVSPSDWIWRRRLERARQDLVDARGTNLLVTTICFKWGFKDVAHFSRAFKTRFGCTPSEARARGGEGEHARLLHAGHFRSNQ